MNVVDLFAGAGGFSLGAHLAGFSVPLAIDLDQNLTSSRPANFPTSKVLHADLASIDPLDALKEAGLKSEDVCGVIGGPPCQGFSYMGSRDPKDPRNQLISEYFRFVRKVQPAFFVLENVPGILTEPFRTVLDQGIDSVGGSYTCTGPLCVNAADFGAATRRHRVMLVGYRKDRVNAISLADIEAQQTDWTATVYDAIHDLPSPLRVFQANGEHCARYEKKPDRGNKGRYARHARALPSDGLGTDSLRTAIKAGIVTGFKATSHTPAVTERFSRLKPGEVDSTSRCPRLAWDHTCPTLRAGTGPERGPTGAPSNPFGRYIHLKTGSSPYERPLAYRDFRIGSGFTRRSGTAFA